MNNNHIDFEHKYPPSGSDRECGYDDFGYDTQEQESIYSPLKKARIKTETPSIGFCATQFAFPIQNVYKYTAASKGNIPLRGLDASANIYALLGKTEDEYRYFSRAQKEDALNMFTRVELQKICKDLELGPRNVTKAKLISYIIDSEGKMDE